MYACLSTFTYCYQSIIVISFSLSQSGPFKRHLLYDQRLANYKSHPYQTKGSYSNFKSRDKLFFFVFLTCILIFSVFYYYIFVFCHANDLEEHFVIQEGTLSQDFEQDLFFKKRNPGKNS